jgi:Transglycosylase SLT domain
MSIPYLACMALVAHLYTLPPRVLPAIQAVEGGGVGMVRQDTNGTADLGVMQVNTSWIPALEAYTSLPASIVRDHLVSRPCFNIAAAGAIMRTYLDQAHGDLLRAVGFYHSHTAVLGEEYRREVLRAARLLFESGKSGQ